MRRLSFILLLLFAFSFPTEGKKVTFGCEWGSGISYANYHVYNYLYENGRRHQGAELEMTRRVNANFMVHLGYDISRIVNIAAYLGYEGITDSERVLPLTLRATCCFKGSKADGFLTYLDAGAGFIKEGYHAMMGRAGVGYRLCLTSVTNLDFLVSYRLAVTHPELRDPDSRRLIEEHRIANNNLFLNNISFSIGLNF